jgi:cation transport regulator ChaB
MKRKAKLWLKAKIVLLILRNESSRDQTTPCDVRSLLVKGIQELLDPSWVGCADQYEERREDRGGEVFMPEAQDARAKQRRRDHTGDEEGAVNDVCFDLQCSSCASAWQK